MNHIAHSFRVPWGWNSIFTNDKENISRGVIYWTLIQGKVYFYSSMRNSFVWLFSSWNGIWCTCVYCKCYKDAHPHESMLSSYSRVRHMRGVTHRGLCYHESTDEHMRAKWWYQNNKLKRSRFFGCRWYFLLSVIFLHFYNFFCNISLLRFRTCFFLILLFLLFVILFFGIFF